MTKATGKTGKKGRERRAGLWVVSLIVSIQVVGLVLFSMATPGVANAKTFLVNSEKDEQDENYQDGICASTPSGVCTLRAAIQEANWLDGPDTIKLPAGLYMLTIPGKEDFCASGDLDIISDGFGNNDLTIIGMGAKKTFINGGKLDRVFHILSPVSVTIAKVTIQNGLATDGGVNQAFGGGILTTLESTLTVKDCVISNNAASHANNASGGAIYSEGTLTIIESTFSNNAVFGISYSGAGGAILNNNGTVTIKGSTISNNAISGNAYGYGGGILNGGIGVITIKGSTISNNTISVDNIAQGGGIANNGTLTITQSTISNNTAMGSSGQGGGIQNAQGPGQKLTIKGSKISNNVARGGSAYGGGICGFNSDSEVIITGSTLSNNAVSGRVSWGFGGGIYVDAGTLTVQNGNRIVQNFASNSGGGLYLTGSWDGIIAHDTTVTKNIPDDFYPNP